MNLCKCGCKQIVKLGNKYIHGHSRRGKKLTEEHKRKIGFRNRKHSEEAKRKISEALKGRIFSDETKRKMSIVQKGRPKSEEYKKKLSKACKGRKITEETRRKISEANKGKNNGRWQGGKSFEPYGEEFNYKLKELIRNRDNKICQLCDKTKKENRKKLTVHHIDYNKKNNKPENLITLCNSCNAEANGNRNYWTEYFQGVINAYN